MRGRPGLATLSIVLTSLGGASLAQTPPEDADKPAFIEREPEPAVLPGPVSPFRAVLDEARAEGGAAWIPRVKTWAPGAKLRVCFLSNNNALNAFVAGHAAAWNAVGANVSYDFGSPAAPRQCRPGVEAAVRVAFHNGGNWSRYGTDAVLGGGQWNDPSIHLDFNTIRSPDARGVIIHEFGHALGMFHEHQKPIDNGCEREFNWPVVYQTMLRYNGWDRLTVDQQVRPVRQFPAIVTNDAIDRSSVMLYAMSPQDFVRGAQSHCYIARPNSEISAMDAEVLRVAYSQPAWEAHSNNVQAAIRDAKGKGQAKVARGLALYKLPKATLDQVAAAFDAEQSLGFNPDPGASAKDQLDKALDAITGAGE